MHRRCHPPGPSLPAAPWDVGCCFSSNSLSIGECREVGAVGSGGSSAAGPGPWAGGRALVRQHSPGAAKALILLIVPCSNFPSSPAVTVLPACRGSGGQASCLWPCAVFKGDKLLPAPWPMGTALCWGQAAACCPAVPTWLPSIQHLMGQRAVLEEEEEEGGVLTQRFPEPPPLSWG